MLNHIKIETKVTHHFHGVSMAEAIRLAIEAHEDDTKHRVEITAQIIYDDEVNDGSMGM
jgi:hypothetical protein